MKNKHISLILTLLLLSACYTVEKPNKPDNLINEDNMVNILIDMAVVSAAKGVNKKIVEKNGIIPDAYIYKKNNTDSLTFAKSNAYYAFYIEKYDAIYLRVKDSLSKLRNKYKAIETKEKEAKKIKDSIKREKIKLKKNYKNKKGRLKAI